MGLGDVVRIRSYAFATRRGWMWFAASGKTQNQGRKRDELEAKRGSRAVDLANDREKGFGAQNVPGDKGDKWENIKGRLNR